MLQDIYFFYQHQEILKKGYSGRYIVIKNETVIGDFCSWVEASLKGLELVKEDAFLIKYCA